MLSQHIEQLKEFNTDNGGIEPIRRQERSETIFNTFFVTPGEIASSQEHQNAR
jgi:hypothetical protein